MPRTGKPPKYDPLRRYLQAAPGRSVTLSFAEIEALLGTGLPAGARTRAGWWANAATSREHYVHAAAWQAAGWGVERVNLFERAVTFVRQPPSG